MTTSTANVFTLPDLGEGLTEAEIVRWRVAVGDMITQLIPKISVYRFTGEDVRNILIGLIDDGLAGQYRDYQGAEQATTGTEVGGVKTR